MFYGITPSRRITLLSCKSEISFYNVEPGFECHISSQTSRVASLFVTDYSENKQNKVINITRINLHSVAKEDLFVKMTLS